METLKTKSKKTKRQSLWIRQYILRGLHENHKILGDPHNPTIRERIGSASRPSSQKGITSRSKVGWIWLRNDNQDQRSHGPGGVERDMKNVETRIGQRRRER